MLLMFPMNMQECKIFHLKIIIHIYRPFNLQAVPGRVHGILVEIWMEAFQSEKQMGYFWKR